MLSDSATSSDIPRIILPGSTIGILGGGQLGRMLTQAAISLGYHVIIYCDQPHSPACEVATDSIIAAYDDEQQLKIFAERVDLVSVEFENIPARSLAILENYLLVCPNSKALYIFQNRLREKGFLIEHNIPCAAYAKIESQSELRIALEKIGIPSILKTGGFGYDGKGQVRISSAEHAEQLLSKPITEEMVLEAFIDFECEVSIIAARSLSGEFKSWGLVRNRHTNHILDISSVPAEVENEIEIEAVRIARSILEKSKIVGVACVEFFLTKDNKLLVNEIAPRVHNSGHLTIEASNTSQFEQHIRAICGLALGNTDYLKPAAMANILGDLWSASEPQWNNALQFPTVALHLYGKKEARPGRKMGHLTVLADDSKVGANLVLSARKALLQGA